MNQNIKYYPQ